MYPYPWEWSFFGMHWFWWIFWGSMLILVFGFATPVPRKTARRFRETPLGTLQRRYAAGEITTAQYEERKLILERDQHHLVDVAERRLGIDRHLPQPQ